jgi:hypothetical protein
MSNLDEALERSRQMITEALADARTELEEVRAREAELERQIADAEAALGQGQMQPAADRAMTLHGAMAQVLRENDNAWMTVRELADTVNSRGLYRKRDDGPVEVNQVHARAHNYSDLFEKDGGNVRLREASQMLSAAPATVTVFIDGDTGFFDWLKANADGYVINTYRNPKPDYLVLHRPQCRHFKGGDSLQWTKEYVKLCSTDLDELETWATDTVGGEVTLCRSCFEA